MNMEQMMNFFKSNYSSIEDMVLEMAIWDDDPSDETLEQVSRGLCRLAENGDKNAAALFCIISAYYEGESKYFTIRQSANLMFNTDSIKEYNKLAEDYFEDTLDSEDYEYMHAFPARLLFAKLSETENNTVTDSTSKFKS